MNKRPVLFSFPIDSDTREALDRVAQSMRRPKGNAIRELIRLADNQQPPTGTSSIQSNQQRPQMA
jgi:hypothetical protein